METWLGWLIESGPAFPGMRMAFTLEVSVTLGVPEEAHSVGGRNPEGLA